MADASSNKDGLTPKTSGLLPEGILLALIPALAYAIALFYEKGFASYFGFPISLIDVDFSSFAVSIMSFLGVVAGLYITANLFFMLWPEDRREDIYYFYPFLFWSLYVLAVFLARGELLPILKSSWPIIPLILVFYVIPIFTYRKEKGYINKIKASWDDEAPVHRRSLTGIIQFKFGYLSVVSLVTILFFVPVLSFNLGVSEAKRKSEFLVFQEESEYVVLRIYGDIMVCAQFQRTERKIVQNFVLKKIGETPSVRLRLERVGPLKVALP